MKEVSVDTETARINSLIGVIKDQKTDSNQIDSAVRELIEIGQSAVQIIANEITTSDTFQRIVFSEILRRIGVNDQEVLGRLVDAGDFTLTSGIRGAGERKVVAKLVEAITDGNGDARAAAFRALTNMIGDVSLTALVGLLLRTSDPIISQEAEIAIRARKPCDEELILRLTSFYDVDGDLSQRLRIISSIAQLVGNRKAIEPLITILSDEVGKETATGLMNGKASKAEFSALHTDKREIWYAVRKAILHVVSWSPMRERILLHRPHPATPSPHLRALCSR